MRFILTGVVETENGTSQDTTRSITMMHYWYILV